MVIFKVVAYEKWSLGESCYQTLESPVILQTTAVYTFRKLRSAAS